MTMRMMMVRCGDGMRNGFRHRTRRGDWYWILRTSDHAITEVRYGQTGLLVRIGAKVFPARRRLHMRERQLVIPPIGLPCFALSFTRSFSANAIHTLLCREVLLSLVLVKSCMNLGQGPTLLEILCT